jgi:hypothetical protein
MEAKYYVVVRPGINEKHAVHKEGCPFLADDENRIYLGRYSSGHDALNASHRHYDSSASCIFCSREQKETRLNTIPYELIKKEQAPSEPEVSSLFYEGLVYCVN